MQLQRQNNILTRKIVEAANIAKFGDTCVSAPSVDGAIMSDKQHQTLLSSKPFHMTFQNVNEKEHLMPSYQFMQQCKRAEDIISDLCGLSQSTDKYWHPEFGSPDINRYDAGLGQAEDDSYVRGM